MSTFKFKARWKEQLICTGPGGSFILDLPMGIFSARLPTESVYQQKAPTWARDLWSVLKIELEAWCIENDAKFVIDKTADVYWRKASKKCNPERGKRF